MHLDEGEFSENKGEMHNRCIEKRRHALLYSALKAAVLQNGITEMNEKTSVPIERTLSGDKLNDHLLPVADLPVN